MENEFKEYEKHFESGFNTRVVTEDIKRYVIDNALKSSRYIFVTKDSGYQIGYCTHCNQEFITPGLKHNVSAECPNCKSACIVKDSWRGRGKLRNESYFVYYEKSKFDTNVIVARGILAWRDYSGDFRNVNTNYSVCNWYIFKMGKSVMIRSNPYCKSKLEICKSIYSEFGRINSMYTKLTYSRESIIEAVKGTAFQYSTWESYTHDDMVKFFDMYSKYPCIEYLTKEGFSRIVEQKLNGYPTYRTINWRAKSIFKVLKIEKSALKEIKEQKIQLTFSFLLVFHDMKKQNWNLTVEEAVNLVKNYEHYYDSLKKATQYAPMKKLLKYFSKQYKNYKKRYYQESGVLSTFKDYIADCQKLGLDINNEHVLFPKDLYTAHQNTIIQIKVEANKKYDDLIQKRLMSLKKYNFEFGGLFIRPAESSKELILEGAELHHCVAAHYTDKYSRGETDILFIRKAAEKDKSFFTMEVKNNRIIQTHGLRNCNPDKELEIFIKAFEKEKLQSKKKNIKTQLQVAV